MIIFSITLKSMHVEGGLSEFSLIHDGQDVFLQHPDDYVFPSLDA